MEHVARPAAAMVVCRLPPSPESQEPCPRVQYSVAFLENLNPLNHVEIEDIGLRGGGPPLEDNIEEAENDEEIDADPVLIMPPRPIRNSEGNPFRLDVDPTRISFEFPNAPDIEQLQSRQRHSILTTRQYPGIAEATTHTSELCSSTNSPHYHAFPQSSSERFDNQLQGLNRSKIETSSGKAAFEQPCDRDSQNRHEHGQACDDDWKPVVDETTLESLREACELLCQAVWLDEYPQNRNGRAREFSFSRRAPPLFVVARNKRLAANNPTQ